MGALRRHLEARIDELSEDNEDLRKKLRWSEDATSHWERQYQKATTERWELERELRQYRKREQAQGQAMLNRLLGIA